MWIANNWYSETELAAYVNDLVEERDAYKQELIDTLRKACTCIAGDDFDCSICPYYDVATNNVCPSKINTYAAKLRLEELVKEK